MSVFSSMKKKEEKNWWIRIIINSSLSQDVESNQSLSTNDLFWEFKLLWNRLKRIALRVEYEKPTMWFVT